MLEGFFMANQKKTVQFDHFHPYYLAQDENGASFI